MTDNVKTLIKMLDSNGFTVEVYSDNMIIVDDAFNNLYGTDRLKDLFAVYGQSQLGMATIEPCGAVNYKVDEVTFTYLRFFKAQNDDQRVAQKTNIKFVQLAKQKFQKNS